MTGLLASAAGVVIVVITMLLALRTSKKQGAAEANTVAQKQIDTVAVAQAEQQVQQVEKVREVEVKLNTDPEYAKRVRDKFSRD